MVMGTELFKFIIEDYLRDGFAIFQSLYATSQLLKDGLNVIKK